MGKQCVERRKCWGEKNTVCANIHLKKEQHIFSFFFFCKTQRAEILYSSTYVKLPE